MVKTSKLLIGVGVAGIGVVLFSGTASDGPTALDFNYSVNDLTVQATGSPDVPAEQDQRTYTWTIKDDSGTVVAERTGKSIEVQLSTGGQYTLTVVSDDPFGGQDTAAQVFTATPIQAPTADFTYSVVGLDVQADAAPSTDPEGSPLSYEWILADGDNNILETSTDSSIDYTLPEGGDYRISLTVTDDDGATDTITESFTASPANQPPVADFTYSVVGLRLEADASPSSDFNMDPLAYAWTVEDSSGSIVFEDTGVTTSTELPSGDDYTLILRVTDDDGASDTVSESFTATSLEPMVEALDLRVDASGFGPQLVAETEISGAVVQTEYVLYGGTDRGDGSIGYDVLEETGPMDGIHQTATFDAVLGYDYYAYDVIVTAEDGDRDTGFLQRQLQV